jgi:phosphoserine phosphatase
VSGRETGLGPCLRDHLVISEDGQALTGELTGGVVYTEKKRQHALDIAAKEDS